MIYVSDNRDISNVLHSYLPMSDTCRVTRGRGVTLGDLICRCGLGRSLLPVVQNQIDFPGLESGQLNIKTKIDQALQLDGEDVAVPAGLCRQCVVGNQIGALICFTQMGQAYRWDCRNTEKFGGFHAAMTGDDVQIVVGQYWVVEAKLAD